MVRSFIYNKQRDMESSFHKMSRDNLTLHRQMFHSFVNIILITIIISATLGY